MNSRATYDQKVWINDKNNRLLIPKLIGESKPGTIEYLNLKNAKLSYSGTVFGTALGDERFDTQREALDHARTTVNDLKLKHKSVKLNTRELGLDGWSIDASDAYSDIIIESCTLMGPVLRRDISVHDNNADLILDFFHFLENSEVPEYLALLKEEAGKRNIVDLDDESDKLDKVIEFLDDMGFFGFLLSISTPIKKYSKDCKSCSYSMGSCYTGWAYGDNFELALRRAEEFRVKYDKYDKERATKK